MVIGGAKQRMCRFNIIAHCFTAPETKVVLLLRSLVAQSPEQLCASNV
jgi:hypothetical protein